MHGHHAARQSVFLPLFLLAILGACAVTAFLPGMARAEDPYGTGHDMTGLREFLDSGIRINGYYTFEYYNDTRSSSPNTFRLHKFDLFVTHDWNQWRVVSELEFEDAPAFEGTGGPTPTVTEANGTVKLEYAWFEYHESDLLEMRGGKFLLPQYWNLNHYPPVTLSTTRPLMVRRVFPMDLLGLMLHGKAFAGRLGMEYEVYTGNGEEPDAGIDQNDNKAVGGNLKFDLAGFFGWVSQFNLAGSFYLNDTNSPNGRDVGGAEIQFKARRLELLGEYAMDTQSNREGFYVQPAIELSEKWHLFYRYGYLDDADVSTARYRHTAGVNWRPRPDISLKLEGISDDYDDSALENNEIVATSIALFF